MVFSLQTCNSVQAEYHQRLPSYGLFPPVPPLSPMHASACGVVLQPTRADQFAEAKHEVLAGNIAPRRETRNLLGSWGGSASCLLDYLVLFFPLNIYSTSTCCLLMQHPIKEMIGGTQDQPCMLGSEVLVVRGMDA